MQKEFRNSQCINIYFHKFDPFRLALPCLPFPLSFGGRFYLPRCLRSLLGSPSPSVCLSPPVSPSPSPSRGLSPCGGGGVRFPACVSVLHLRSLRSLRLSCLCASLSLSRPPTVSPPVGVFPRLCLPDSLLSGGPSSRLRFRSRRTPGPVGPTRGWGTPLKARKGREVVSPATGGRTEEPRGMRINRPAGTCGGGERLEPRPGHAPYSTVGGAYLGRDFRDSWARRWRREVGPWQVISQSVNQSVNRWSSQLEARITGEAKRSWYGMGAEFHSL